MDTISGHELSVTADQDYFETENRARVVLADTTKLPGFTITMTPAEARILISYLEEKALEAELTELEDDDMAGVPMVCTSCKKPVSYSGGDRARGYVGGTWTHDDVRDASMCPVSSVMAMVAAGADRA